MKRVSAKISTHWTARSRFSPQAAAGSSSWPTPSGRSAPRSPDSPEGLPVTGCPRSSSTARPSAWSVPLSAVTRPAYVRRCILAQPEVRGLDGYAALEQDRIAVRVDDLPAVQVVEEQNLQRVKEWLA